MKTMQAVLLFAACAALACAASANLQMQGTHAGAGAVRVLPPFSSILSAVPFNVLVLPGDYSVKVAADKPVVSALVTNVANGLLRLTTNGIFSTNKPIKVTVRLPAGSLTGVSVTGASSLVVGSGFTATKSFSARANGASKVSAMTITAAQCNINAQGASQAAIAGRCGTATVITSGAASAYVGTVMTSASAQASGASRINIKTANQYVPITAALSGVASVAYNQGGNSRTTSCKQGPVRPPQLTDQWTCGLVVRDSNGVTANSSPRCDDSEPAAAHAAAMAPPMAAAPAEATAPSMAAAPAPGMALST